MKRRLWRLNSFEIVFIMFLWKVKIKLSLDYNIYVISKLKMFQPEGYRLYYFLPGREEKKKIGGGAFQPIQMKS